MKEIAENDAILRRVIAKLPRVVRLRAQNALLGIDRADALFDIDREMASFRAITAQEEAAAALFRSLKLRKYPGAEKLNLGNHRHKAAVYPFIEIVWENIATSFDGMKATLTLNAEKGRVDVHLPAAYFGVLEDKPDIHLTPDEPLNLLQSQNGKPYLFVSEIKNYAKRAGKSRIDRVVREVANARNTLLYANDQVLPESQATLEDLHFRRRSIAVVLILTIAVSQVKTPQLFAMQCLQAFLGILQADDGVVFSYPAQPPADFELHPKKKRPAVTPEELRKIP